MALPLMSLPDTLPLLFGALLLEAALGYPQALYARIGHPVTWIGGLIGWLDRSLNRETASFAARRRRALSRWSCCSWSPAPVRWP